ncbi:acyl-CoA carboxylase epsilon subunit, partial [Streptomyces sp. NPDC046685]|uniref:acyl-CoA carboxylase epsilon subunit n=1 Tax=Streptomyces sp. NPDC046685 TaxID=3157202 RepID=UPI0033C9D6CC
MSNDVPIASLPSLLRVERGHAAPEELAAIAVVVACYAAHRTSGDRDGERGAEARARFDAAREALGFEASVGFAEGMALTARW